MDAIGMLKAWLTTLGPWVESLLGRTRSDDDGQVFRLLVTAGDTFGYGVSPEVRRRAALQES